MKSPQHTLIFLLLILFYSGSISAQDPDQSIYIDNPTIDTLFYCGNPVSVAPDIVIENFDIEKPSDGIRVSIVNYVPGEDTLRYIGVDGTDFLATWNDTIGNLEITGQGTASELQQAVRQVYYENSSETPVTEFRSISVSLLDADFLPETRHFYQYVSNVDITWREAREAAEAMEYHGLQGYLATITSSIENDFIWSKIDGIGWIGASDETENETWKWVTGPEGLYGGTVFWQGDASGQPVDSLYSNWSEGEPNNDWGAGHYAHVSQDPNKSEKTWNDLPNEGGGGIYRSQGYVVEFGGMPNDPVIKLSASAVIGVNQVPEVIIGDYDTLVCGERHQQLQIKIDQEISTILRPLDSNSIVLDSTSLNPTVEVQASGHYRFELETFNENQCSWFDTILISFQHQPIAELNLTEAICVDYDLELSFEGEVEGDAIFEWFSNDTVYTSGSNLDSLIIPLGEGIANRTVGLKVIEYGCTDSIQVPVTVKPRVVIQADPPEGCTPLDVQFEYTATEQITEQFWEFGNESSASNENPVVTFESADADAGNFDVSLAVVSAEGCESSLTIENMIRVHPLPTVDISIDESVCYKGNEEIHYIGTAGSRDTFIWDLSNIAPADVIQAPGNSEGPLRLNLTGSPVADIGLQVISEFGCKSDTLVKTYKRDPIFSVPPDTLGGCPPFEVNLSISTDDFTDQVDYFWNLGNGNTDQGSSVSQAYTGENSFFDVAVYGMSALTGCADTLLLPGKIFVYPVPEASFTANPISVLVTDPEVRFENESRGATRYEWDFADNSFGSTAENPVHSFENLGLFDVSLLAVNEFGCSDSAFTRISVSFDRLFPPTAFSPNAALEEDREFRIYGEGIVNDGYKLLIFNRWGEVIYTSNTPEEGWDGKMRNGANAPAGSYFWVLEYLDLLGKEHSQKGTVTLLY